ncbi:alpha/beta-hydrolase [Pluteus cervinus]|uniref:Alpha/beta-hydrolase n=1 Tax=Pluteus cervinus TaxID=181527 RepID=A0ACD3AZG3_9AGAR|nr:alpha/beta-hydrolase [Pluteus cervinus]
MGDPEPKTTGVPISVPYKSFNGRQIFLDIYPPTPFAPGQTAPALIFFHGGGLVVGNRKSWFPTWLQTRMNSTGIAFISADYRLMPQATVHDILKDVKDVFAFVRDRTGNRPDANHFSVWDIDPAAIGVAGSSGGGILAYLAGTQVSPRPTVVVSLYGQGASSFNSHWLEPKKGDTVLGIPRLDKTLYLDYLSQPSWDLPPPSIYDPTSVNSTPKDVVNPRALLPQLYIQEGVFTDFITGQHNPSISAKLHSALANVKEGDEIPNKAVRKIIPWCHRRLFPQLQISASWPPTVIIHGTADILVPYSDSQKLIAQLSQQLPPEKVELVGIEGQGHIFDLVSDAEEKFGVEFYRVAGFIEQWIRVPIKTKDWTSCVIA